MNLWALIIAAQELSHSIGPATNRAVPAQEARIVEIFKNACYEGKVRLTAAEAIPLKREAAPYSLKQWFHDTKQVTFYKLDVAPNTYMINFIGLDKGLNYKSGCAIATRAVSGEDLWINLTEAVLPTTGPTSRIFANSSKLEMSRPHQGFTITDITVDRYAILQASMLNDLDIKQRIADEIEMNRLIAKHKGPITQYKWGQ